MAKKRSSYRGCLLGLAVGDAMGYTVNSHSLAEIQEDYGPNGLQGYDPVNGYAEVTSCTQLAAFTANGLLYGLTIGRSKGTMSPFINPRKPAAGRFPDTSRCRRRSDVGRRRG